jgi:hypothetical protein
VPRAVQRPQPSVSTAVVKDNASSSSTDATDVNRDAGQQSGSGMSNQDFRNMLFRR